VSNTNRKLKRKYDKKVNYGKAVMQVSKTIYLEDVNNNTETRFV